MMLSNLLMQNKLRFATCITIFAVMAACGVTAAIYTFVIPRDILNELMITIPVATIVSFPIAWYIGSISIQLKRVNSELLQAQIAAESAERVKGEFLANMSHEIRTPMNGVMGMVELLAKTNLDQQQRTFTDVILKSGNALVTIINDILDYSKTDSGQLALDLAPFRLDQAVEEIVTLFSTRILEKDLEIMVRINPSLPRNVIGDVGRLRQIIGNLVSNAIKFTESGHVLLEVAGEVNNKDATANLTFRVQDTGIGIPSEQINSIFDKFSQIDMSATRKHEGTGLGLAISASLVKLMGGNMEVESEIGVGSTFWFTVTLPLAENAPPRQLAPADVSGARILVIDENSISRAILMEQINAWQFDAACATSGEEALALMSVAAAHGIQIDLIIFDYHIRDLSGVQILAALKADPATANIPLLMMSSIDQIADSRIYSSLGIAAQLTKPVS